jgi:hypothetical protein
MDHYKFLVAVNAWVMLERIYTNGK